MTNLADNLVAAAAKDPAHVALRCGPASLTYGQFDGAAAKFASLLASEGIEPGDRVGIMLPNTPAFAVVFYGIMRRGAIAVPMNPLLKGGEVEFYLANTSAKLLVGTPMFAEAANEGAALAGASALLVDDASLLERLAGFDPQAEPVERDDLDTAVVLHTSGTTGKPKGAELTHGGLGKNAEVTVRTLVELSASDVVMGCLPLFHVFGLTCGLNSSVLVGATLSLVPRFEPTAVMETIARDGVTVFLGVPTMYAALLSVAAKFPPETTASLRSCISGGAALPVQVLNDFEKTFGAIILEGYGLSESSPVACFNHPGRERKAGTIGQPIEGVEMRLVDNNGAEITSDEPGEIQIRGHNVMKGYWNLPDATASTITADGWLSTGDIATVDADGFYTIVDRKKELIIRGGFNVYPREIEEALYAHPAVAEAGVIGIPHPTLGEEIGAAVALKEGASAQPEELRDFVKERVAAYKYPRHVWIVDALPKGPTGKILRREITAPAVEGVN